MNKKLLLFALVICSTVLVSSLTSAADAHVFTDVSDARLLAIDNVGNTNATGWLAENGIKLSDTYCALTGCTFSGNIVVGELNATTIYLGGVDLSSLIVNHTSITFDLYNASWDNRGLIDEQNTSIAGYIDAQDVYYNTSIAGYVDDQIAGVGTSDFTNVAYINNTNTFTPQQVFTNGLSSAENIILNTTKAFAWDDGGQISATAGVITYKAGV